jgi:hypothetical protein
VTKLGKIISGGQTGVDQAALRAARASGLSIGGWCPPGRICESGLIPLEFELQETLEDRSVDAPEVARSQRTEWNVRDSDATLVVRPENVTDSGTTWATRCATRYGRPFLECDPADREALTKVTEWLGRLQIQTLNVAGPSERTVPGIGRKVYALLMNVLSRSARR